VPDPRNLVVVSNHVSHLDAPVLLQALGLDFRAIVKKEIMSWPFLGRILRFAGFVPVDRSDREQSTRAVSATAESLKGGQCFLVFPEGTRSRTGALGEFKKGGFVAAIEAKSRILPVAISGTRPLLPRGRFRVRPGTVRVQVLDPMDAGGYSYSDRDRLVADVRERIARALDEVEREESEEPGSE
jgi:1-acyl-sn-glycerol-3-phosphate acyltransferase